MVVEIIDPWGKILVDLKTEQGIGLAEINLSNMERIRREMPVLKHTREDTYAASAFQYQSIHDTDTYKFGEIPLSGAQLFLKTSQTMAFVNKMPVLPGHVLLSPLRKVQYLKDLTRTELSDLFACVQAVEKAIQQEFNATSSTVAVQNGPEAGQTIPHVHVHVLPRKAKDFAENDDIYQQLEEKTSSRTIRSNEDMAEEAMKLRKYFNNY